MSDLDARKTTLLRKALTAVKCASLAFCLFMSFMWGWSGEPLIACAWSGVGGFYLSLIYRPARPAPVKPRPDYARIAQLERELGIGPKENC